MDVVGLAAPLTIVGFIENDHDIVPVCLSHTTFDAVVRFSGDLLCYLN